MMSCGMELMMLLNCDSFVDSSAYVRVDGVMSVWCDINVGVHQGCVMTPQLFNLYLVYLDEVMREVKINNARGVNLVCVGQLRVIKVLYNKINFMYAQDSVLLSVCEGSMQTG